MQASNLPSKVLLPFANSGTKNAIPVDSQIGITPGAASLTDGFPPLTFTPLASGGVPPAGADFNGILNLITAVQQWQSAGGIFKYDSAFSTSVGGYPKGAILESSDGSTLWLCLADNNTTDPDGATPANWAPATAYGIATITGLTNVNVTLTPAQYSKQIITLAGTLTGNVQIIFPTTQQQWTVINNTTGAFTVTCKTASGTGVQAAQGSSNRLYGDGTNISEFYVVSGLANVQVFTSSGTYIRSTGVKSVVVEVIGGGGGGAGVPTSSAGQITVGGGGGAGGYAMKRITAPGATEAVTVGVGGTGGAAGTSGVGGTGGTSSFGSWVSATGGIGGVSMGGAVAAFTTSGGAGGTPTGATVSAQGMFGDTGFGTYPLVVGGKGGSSQFGTGGLGGNLAAIGQSSGATASGFGCGGGGSATAASAQIAGGSGSPGVVIVYEYY